MLVASNDGNPTTASLCRAVSSGYYALFHQLAENCADLMIGNGPLVSGSPAWRRFYRALEHGHARVQCKQHLEIANFSAQVRAFATLFVDMQAKRHYADYDPDAIFHKSDVAADLVAIADVVAAFETAHSAERRAFCAFVLLRDRKS